MLTPDYASETLGLTIYTDMAGCKVCFLFAVSAMLVSGASAGGKKINGLNFQLALADSCFSQYIYIWPAPDPYFENLTQRKIRGIPQYRRGNNIVASFPDSTTVLVVFWQDLSALSACGTAFDPARLKFYLLWNNDSQTIPANVKSVFVRKSLPQNWCEYKCSTRWTYELKIDSQDVPLHNDLLLRIESEDGGRLAEYVGKLSAEPPPAPPFVH